MLASVDPGILRAANGANQYGASDSSRAAMMSVGTVSC
jgi:hypothetical protein